MGQITADHGERRQRLALPAQSVFTMVDGLLDVALARGYHPKGDSGLAQGVDQRVVMEILGHSQISMTSKYAHVLPEVMTDAAERIGRALWGEP
jgi:integrase